MTMGKSHPELATRRDRPRIIDCCRVFWENGSGLLTGILRVDGQVSWHVPRGGLEHGTVVSIHETTREICVERDRDRAQLRMPLDRIEHPSLVLPRRENRHPDPWANEPDEFHPGRKF